MRIEARDWMHSDNININIDETPQWPVAACVSRATGKVSPETGKKYLLPLALVACILVLCGCEGEPTSAAMKPVDESRIEIKAVRPRRGEVYRFINLPGEVRPLYEVTLFAKVDGYLEKLTVDKGDSVKAGDLIADIDVPELRANLVKYKAELELAQAEFKETSETA